MHSMNDINIIVELLSTKIKHLRLNIDIDYKYKNLDSIKIELTGENVNFQMFGNFDAVYNSLIKYINNLDGV